MRRRVRQEATLTEFYSREVYEDELDTPWPDLDKLERDGCDFEVLDFEYIDDEEDEKEEDDEEEE